MGYGLFHEDRVFGYCLGWDLKGGIFFFNSSHTRRRVEVHGILLDLRLKKIHPINPKRKIPIKIVLCMLKYQSGAVSSHPITLARKKCQEIFKRNPIAIPWIVTTGIMIIFFIIDIKGLGETAV